MHEMGIANSILDAVRAETRRFPGDHISKVGVKIGELAGVDPDSMSFCFEVLVRGTDLEPLILEIEYCPRSYRCRYCGGACSAPVDDLTCTFCGAPGLQFAAGDELNLSYLEVEDGTRAAGA